MDIEYYLPQRAHRRTLWSIQRQRSVKILDQSCAMDSINAIGADFCWKAMTHQNHDTKETYNIGT